MSITREENLAALENIARASENAKMEMACHMRAAIKDLPEPVPAPDLADLLDQAKLAADTILAIGQGVASHLEGGQTQGGMDDADVIATLKEAEEKGVDLREHGDFPYRLAARHGRTEVMKFLASRKTTRPSQDSMIFAMMDALDGGHLEAARFVGKNVLGGIPALMRELVEKRREVMELNDLLQAQDRKIQQLKEEGGE